MARKGSFRHEFLKMKKEGSWQGSYREFLRYYAPIVRINRIFRTWKTKRDLIRAREILYDISEKAYNENPERFLIMQRMFAVKGEKLDRLIDNYKLYSGMRKEMRKLIKSESDKKAKLSEKIKSKPR